MNITIKISKEKDVREDAFSIRQQVFVDEQGFVNEFDSIDDTAYHLCAYDGGTPIGSGRLFSEKGDKEYHIGRIAVISEYRGKNIGALIMNALEAYGKGIGAELLCLSAQTRASGFYEKLGFTRYGEEYFDEYCPHIAMKKEL